MPLERPSNLEPSLIPKGTKLAKAVQEVRISDFIAWFGHLMKVLPSSEHNHSPYPLSWRRDREYRVHLMHSHDANT